MVQLNGPGPYFVARISRYHVKESSIHKQVRTDCKEIRLTKLHIVYGDSDELRLLHLDLNDKN